MSQNKIKKTSFILSLLISTFFLYGSTAMSAEEKNIQTNKTVEELKKEVLHRSAVNLYPIFGIPENIMENTIKNIQSLKVKEWSEAFIISGNFYYKSGLENEKNNKNIAIENYSIAQKLYNMGRWPAVTSKERNISYIHEREAFEAINRLNGTRLHFITSVTNGKEITGDLVLPKKITAPVPLVISIGGGGWLERGTGNTTYTAG